MTGYVGYSKSVNAIEAEEERLCFPRTQLAKILKVDPEAIENILEPSEWHHVSCRYNKVDYYQGAALMVAANIISKKEAFLIDDPPDEDDLIEGKKILKKIKKWKNPNKPYKKDNVTVTYDQWYKVGFGKWAKWKKESIVLKNASVQYKGKKMVFITHNKKTFRKRIDKIQIIEKKNKKQKCVL